MLDDLCEFNELGEFSGGTPGTPDELVDVLSEYVEIGFRHLIFQFLAPYDFETMERLVHEVRPRLEDRFGT